MRVLDEPGTYERLEQSSERLAAGLSSAAAKSGVPLTVNRCGSMLCPYLSSEPVTCFDDVMRSDREGWTRFFHAMLEGGVLLAPSPFEAWFLSTAHDDDVVDAIAAAAEAAFAAVKA